MTPSPAARAALAALALTAMAVGCCPPLRPSYATPERTLLTWQAHLCRDEVEGEYGCLSYDLKRAMAGFETYHAARARLLAEEPVVAWLLSRADLLEHLVDARVDRQAGTAELVLESRGQRVRVGLVRELAATVELEDGQQLYGRLAAPLDELITRQGTAQWIRLDRPRIDADALLALRALTIEPRWKIDAIEGLSPAIEMIP